MIEEAFLNCCFVLEVSFLSAQRLELSLNVIADFNSRVIYALREEKINVRYKGRVCRAISRRAKRFPFLIGAFLFLRIRFLRFAPLITCLELHLANFYR